jgi:hypothetical protein
MVGVMVVFQDAIYRLQELGLVDVILPFILIFTILYAILEKVKLFGEKAGRYNVIIALAIAAGVVIPHVTGGYGPLGYDPIVVLQGILPGFALVIVTVVTVGIVMGLLGMKVEKGLLGGYSTVGIIVSIIALISLGLIIIYNIYPAFLPYEWTAWLQDESTQAVIAVIAIFALVIWFVTRQTPEEADEAKRTANRKARMKEWFGEGLE